MKLKKFKQFLENINEDLDPDFDLDDNIDDFDNVDDFKKEIDEEELGEEDFDIDDDDDEFDDEFSSEREEEFAEDPEFTEDPEPDEYSSPEKFDDNEMILDSDEEEEGHEYKGNLIMRELADKLGAEVVNNQIDYNGQKINYFSETEKIHIGKNKFETIEEVLDYLNPQETETGNPEEIKVPEQIGQEDFVEESRRYIKRFN